MHKVTITVSDALTILSNIVREFGSDYKNVGTCLYVTDGASSDGYRVDPFDLRPKCIVGQVFSRLGILRVTLVDGSEASNEGAVTPFHPIWDRAETCGVTFTPEARLLLQFAQEAQDGRSEFSGGPTDRMTWHDATAEALVRVQQKVEQEFLENNPVMRLTF